MTVNVIATVIFISAAVYIITSIILAGVVLIKYRNRGKLLWKTSPLSNDVCLDHIKTSKFSGYAADALFMVKIIEQTHPIFITDGYLPDDYVAKRDRFLSYSQNEISKKDFIFATLEYVTTLKDGHMSGSTLFMTPLPDMFPETLLDVSWVVQHGRLLIKKCSGSSTILEVIEIGGVPTQEIFKTIDKYIFTENEFDREKLYALYSRFSDFIELAGGQITNNHTQIKIKSNGNVIVENMALNHLELADKYYVFYSKPSYTIRHEMKGDVFYIDLRWFFEDKAISETERCIQQAVKDGTRKFIVDLRGNIGGNSLIGMRLLKAMGITPPSHGCIRRFSKLFVRRTPILQRLSVWLISLFAHGSIATPITAINSHGVFVTVLTDIHTYSSATMMAGWIQDSDLGNIVGTPSSNSPSAFGNSLTFKLPYSKVSARVSFDRFLRPDTNADQSTLWPDIVVDPDKALDAALEHLRHIE
jgi:hypothetical protein